MNDKRFQKRLDKIKKRGERYKQEKELRDAYAQYVPEKKRKKVTNVLLVVIVLAIVTYTAASFWLTYASGMSIDPTLTTCFYTFWGSELVLLAGIKTSKIIKGTDDHSTISNDDDCCG